MPTDPAFRVPYILLADQVQTDVGHNKVNILGVFDRVFCKELPMFYPGFFVVVLLAVEQEDGLGRHRVSIRFVRPGGQTEVETGGDIEFRAGGGAPYLASIRLVIGMQGVPFREHGRHRIQLLVDDAFIAEHPLVAAPPPDSP